jgi:hypothetical protein
VAVRAEVNAGLKAVRAEVNAEFKAVRAEGLALSAFDLQLSE